MSHETDPPPAKIPPKNISETDEFKELVTELNELVQEWKKLTPEYSPPPFSEETLLDMLRENAKRLTPDLQGGVLLELQAALEGSEPEDFLDPDTWRGIWYILNYSIQERSESVKAKLDERVLKLPGGELLINVRDSLEGSSPKDFLDPDTWRGLWMMVSYSLDAQRESIKRKILGDEDE